MHAELPTVTAAQPIAPSPTSARAADTAVTGSPDPVLVVAGLAILVVVVGLVGFVVRRSRG